VQIDYPSEDDEIEIVRLVRGEQRGNGGAVEKPAPIPQDAVFAARREIDAVTVAEAAERYIVDLVFATRYPERYSDDLKRFIQIGGSPRASLGLDRCARAHAWLRGNDHVTPDDVRAIVHDVLRHRLRLSYEANAEGITPDQIIADIVKQVAVA
jgi:MoxR-like ATPase